MPECDKLFQVAAKKWATSEVRSDLLDALRSLLDPQGELLLLRDRPSAGSPEVLRARKERGNETKTTTNPSAGRSNLD